jgi:cytoskeletal protein CcmA (bactofilin family)
MKGLQKIKASALQFAILVSVIIAILLASFLALTHTHSLFGLQSQLLLTTIDTSQKGISFSLDPNNTIADSLLIEEENLSTTIKKSAWGGFLKVESISNSKTKSFSKIGLIGQRTENQRTAIWSTETQMPLVLVGDTEIEGNAYVSNRGIKAGVISGKYFNGDKLLDGEIKITDGQLPTLDKTWQEQTQSLLDNFIAEDTQLVGLEVENKNSFFQPSQIIYEKGKLVLDQTFVGNIIIKSDDEIIVSQFAKLTDVLLIAPKITVQKGFKGNAHFLASKNIKLEEETTFLYPSSIVVLDKSEDFKTPIPKGEEPIFLSENVTFSGIIMYLPKENPEQHSLTSISFQSKVEVMGSIYCLGNMELSGTVKGTIYTERFLVNEFGSRYINHIYNGKILSKQLPKEFCGLPFSEKKKGVVQWLY